MSKIFASFKAMASSLLIAGQITAASASDAAPPQEDTTRLKNDLLTYCFNDKTQNDQHCEYAFSNHTHALANGVFDTLTDPFQKDALKKKCQNSFAILAGNRSHKNPLSHIEVSRTCLQYINKTFDQDTLPEARSILSVAIQCKETRGCTTPGFD